MATSKVTPTTIAAGATTEKRSTTKLDTIREIERQMQSLWDGLKVFEVDVPANTTDKYGLFMIMIALLSFFYFR